MWCWIRDRVLKCTTWRARECKSSGADGDSKKPTGAAGSTEVGWLRLLGTVAASRGDRRSLR